MEKRLFGSYSAGVRHWVPITTSTELHAKKLRGKQVLVVTELSNVRSPLVGAW